MHTLFFPTAQLGSLASFFTGCAVTVTTVEALLMLLLLLAMIF
jgi:hypothetical protein